jgi:hypothetical protein
VLVGIIMFIAAFPILWGNEACSVKTENSLKEGASAVVSVAADKVDPANDNKLVHMTAEAATNDSLEDAQFSISANAIRLRREVQMYQWREKKESRTRNKLGGGTETVTEYVYDKEWSSELHKSSEFRHPEDHENPDKMRFESFDVNAKDVKLGEFKLSDSLISKMDNFESLPVTNAEKEKLSAEISDGAKIAEQGFYFGGNPGEPKVGDTKIFFKVVKPTTVSVIAKQVGNSFEPYATEAGRDINLLQIGAVSAENMFKSELEKNTIFTWIIRVVGFLLMWIGLAMVFRPISVVADVIPFAGDMLGLGIGIFAGFAAFGLSFITIAIAWIFYRPLLGLLLLALGIGAIILLKYMGLSRKKRA